MSKIPTQKEVAVGFVII